MSGEQTDPIVRALQGATKPDGKDPALWIAALERSRGETPAAIPIERGSRWQRALLGAPAAWTAAAIAASALLAAPFVWGPREQTPVVQTTGLGRDLALAPEMKLHFEQPMGRTNAAPQSFGLVPGGSDRGLGDAFAYSEDARLGEATVADPEPGRDAETVQPVAPETADRAARTRQPAAEPGAMTDALAAREQTELLEDVAGAAFDTAVEAELFSRNERPDAEDPAGTERFGLPVLDNRMAEIELNARGVQAVVSRIAEIAKPDGAVLSQTIETTGPQQQSVASLRLQVPDIKFDDAIEQINREGTVAYHRMVGVPFDFNEEKSAEPVLSTIDVRVIEPVIEPNALIAALSGGVAGSWRFLLAIVRLVVAGAVLWVPALIAIVLLSRSHRRRNPRPLTESV